MRMSVRNSLLTILAFWAVMPSLAQTDARLSEARTLLVQHDAAGAEKMARDYLKENASSAYGHFLLGYILFTEQKAEESLAEYTAGARYQKPSAADMMAVGADYVLLKDNEDADRLFKQVTDMEPQNELAWYYLGRARYYENRYDDAVKAFGMCLRLKPNDVPAETNLGLALKELGRDEEAKQAYLQAMEWEKASGGRDGQPYLDMGLILRREQKIEESRSYLQSAADLEPNNPETHFEFAKTLEDLKKYPEAEAQLRQVLSLDPHASAAHYILGRVLKAEGHLAEANAEFAETSRLNGSKSAKDVSNFNLSDAADPKY